MGKGMLSLDENNKQKLLRYFDLIDPFNPETGRRKLGGKEDIKNYRSEGEQAIDEKINIELDVINNKIRNRIRNKILSESIETERILKIDENITRTKKALDYFNHEGKRFFGSDSTEMRNIKELANDFFTIAQSLKDPDSETTIEQYNDAWRAVQSVCRHYIEIKLNEKPTNERTSTGQKRFHQVENILNINNIIDEERYIERDYKIFDSSYDIYTPRNSNEEAEAMYIRNSRNKSIQDQERLIQKVESLPNMKDKVKLVCDSIVGQCIGMDKENGVVFEVPGINKMDVMFSIFSDGDMVDQDRLESFKQEMAKYYRENNIKIGKAFVAKYKEIKNDKNYQNLSEEKKMQLTGQIIRNTPIYI